MATTKKLDLQQFTKLPLEVVEVASRPLPDLIVMTPHRGKVEIKLKEEMHPLFGSVTQVDKHSKKIIQEIAKLEREAKNHLLDNWLKTNNN